MIKNELNQSVKPVFSELKVQKQGWFTDHPVTASLTLMLFYIIFLILPQSLILINELLYIIGIMSGLFLLFFYITPKFLHIPNGKESFSEFVDTIRINRVVPFKQTIVLSTLTVFVFLTFGLLTSFMTGKYVFDLRTITFTFITAIIPGVFEEVAFRGVILTLLLKKYGVKKAVIISSTLFGLMHLFNLLGPEGASEAMLIITSAQVVWTFFFGIFFSYLFLKTNSLVPGIVAHYLVDVFAPLLVYTPDADPVLKGVLMSTFVVIPFLINMYLIKWITSKWKSEKTYLEKYESKA